MSSRDLPALRECVAADEPFLRALFRSTRIDELAPLGWSETQLDAFCNSQFDAQTIGYRNVFPDAEYFVIAAGDAPAGRLTKARTEEGLLLVDIALMPEYRNRGWGATLVRALQDEARLAGLPLVARVDIHSRASRFYQRLGFTITATDGVRYSMIWHSG